jgi:hypothetical protein
MDFGYLVGYLCVTVMTFGYCYLSVTVHVILSQQNSQPTRRSFTVYSQGFPFQLNQPIDMDLGERLRQLSVKVLLFTTQLADREGPHLSFRLPLSNCPCSSFKLRRSFPSPTESDSNVCVDLRTAVQTNAMEETWKQVKVSLSAHNQKTRCIFYLAEYVFAATSGL